MLPAWLVPLHTVGMLSLDEFLKWLGFVQLTSDPCVYVTCELIVGMYVDDIVIGESGEKIQAGFE